MYNKNKDLTLFLVNFFAFIFPLPWGCALWGAEIFSPTLPQVTAPGVNFVYDAENRNVLPPKFRSSKDPFHVPLVLELFKRGRTLPTREGLDTLNASASGQFFEKGLHLLQEKAGPQELCIVDTRGEFHGFVNKAAVSWYGSQNAENKDKSPELIEKQEKLLLKHLEGMKQARIYKIFSKIKGWINKKIPLSIRPREVESEAALLKRKNVKYRRFHTTDHHRPGDKIVDGFVAFVWGLPETTWLHFHCRGGAGRSSTFFIMYDILKNAKNVEFDDIVNRHRLLGSIDMLRVSTRDPRRAWKTPAQRKRRKFIEKFYRFARDPHGYGHRTWSEWLKVERTLFRDKLTRMHVMD